MWILRLLFFYLCSDYGKHLEDALTTVEPKVNIDHGVNQYRKSSIEPPLK